jgi:hypothetical protein
MKTEAKRGIKLDPSKLLGFDQVKQKPGDKKNAAIGARIGVKVGAKAGTKTSRA